MKARLYRHRAVVMQIPEALRPDWFVFGIGDNWEGQSNSRVIDRFDTKRHATKCARELNKLYALEDRLIEEKEALGEKLDKT